jgi:hypothetical protein
MSVLYGPQPSSRCTQLHYLTRRITDGACLCGRWRRAVPRPLEPARSVAERSRSGDRQRVGRRRPRCADLVSPQPGDGSRPYTRRGFRGTDAPGVLRGLAECDLRSAVFKEVFYRPRLPTRGDLAGAPLPHRCPFVSPRSTHAGTTSLRSDLTDLTAVVGRPGRREPLSPSVEHSPSRQARDTSPPHPINLTRTMRGADRARRYSDSCDYW